MLRVCRALENILRLAGIAVAWLGIPLIIVTASLEPVLRWAGVPGDLPFGEAATSAFFALTMTTFGYAYVLGAHVRLDFFSHRFTSRARAAIELAGVVLILLPLCALVIVDGTESAWRAFGQGERWGDSPLGIQWLVRAAVPIGFLLLMLAGTAAALRAIRALGGK